MEQQITFNENFLLFPEKSIEFDYNIRKIEFIDELVIVLTEIPEDDDTINNLFAFNLSGVPIWRVEPIKNKFPKLENILPYEDVSIIEGKISTVDFIGRRFFINPLDGELIEFKVVK